MSQNIPTNKELYNRVKAAAKAKFDTWPSAYGSAWLVKEYKKRGGTYKKAEMGMEVDEYGQGGMLYADQAYMYGGEDTDMEEYAKGGGIPERYKKKGFTKVGVKKKSTRPGKKWMVLAKKGDKYKVVHGGYKGMKDYTQHKNKNRQKRFWDRMGGRDSAKAKDPFSPLYWHKRFGTWEDGGETFNEDSMDFYSKGGTNNAGFEALPLEVQQQILDNMGIGGECYACGGQKKKYQFAGQTIEGPFTEEEIAAIQERLQPTILDEVTVTGNYEGIKPKPLPRFDVATPELNLVPISEGSSESQEDSKEGIDKKLVNSLARIAGVNSLNSFMESVSAQKRQADMRSNYLTDNFIPLNTGNDRGDYDINTGIFRPDSYVPTQFTNQFAQGGQIGMVDDELLQELIAAGADIEIID
jgi:hypothetical protein